MTDFTERKKECITIGFLILLLSLVTAALYRMHLFGPYVYIFRDAGSDTYNSYWPVMEYLVRHIQDGDLHFWMFQSGFGNNIISTLHLLADPFSLLLLLFPKDTMALGLVWVMAAKTIAGGVLFYLFAREISFSRILSILTAIMWTFSSYMTLWGQHYFFSNVLPMFALLMLGVARLLHRKGGKIFIFAVWLSFINFIYFAVWFSIATVIIALLCYILEENKSVRHFLGYIWMFFWRGVLAFLLAAFRTIPEICSFLNTARFSGGTAQTGFFSTKQDIYDALLRAFSNNSLGENLTVNIFGYNYYEQIMLSSSILTLLFLFHNIIVRKGREKVFCIVTGLLIVLSVCTNAVNVLMNIGKGNSYRWSFLIIFALIVNAGFALQDTAEHFRERKRLLLVESVFGVVLFAGTFLVLSKAYGSEFSEEELLQILPVQYGIAIFLAAYLSIFLFLSVQDRWFHSEAITIRSVGFVLIAVVCAEVFTLNDPTINNRTCTWKNSVYSSTYYDPINLQPFQQIYAMDDGLYRIEKDYRMGFGNDPLVMGYCGTTTYGMESAGIQQMLEENGLYRTGYGVSELILGHPSLESVLGIKYYIAEDYFSEDGYERITDTPDAGLRYIYLNHNAYPLIYTATDENAAVINQLIHGGELPADGEYPEVTGLEVTSFQDDLITGNINTSPGSSLYTSITYDAGWHVFVDGRETQTMPVYSGFLGAQIPDGVHEVRLSFFPVGLKAGILVSTGTAGGLFVFFILSRRKTKIKENR